MMTPMVSSLRVAPRYRRIAPSPSLAPYVEYYWTLQGVRDGIKQEILIPNGRPTLMLGFAGVSTRTNMDTGRTEALGHTIVGITTRPYLIEGHGRGDYFGIQFTPYGLAALSTVPVRTTIDRVLRIEDWVGEAHAQQLSGQLVGIQPAARAALLDSWLRSQYADHVQPDVQTLQRVITAFDNAPSNTTVALLADQLTLPYHRLYDLFVRYVGIPPKQYLEIMRSYRFIGQRIAADHSPSAVLAAMQGYYDEAHASKEFRRFTGMTQKTFLHTYSGIARQMHNQLS